MCWVSELETLVQFRESEARHPSRSRDVHQLALLLLRRIVPQRILVAPDRDYTANSYAVRDWPRAPYCETPFPSSCPVATWAVDSSPPAFSAVSLHRTHNSIYTGIPQLAAI